MIEQKTRQTANGTRQLSPYDSGTCSTVSVLTTEAHRNIGRANRRLSEQLALRAKYTNQDRAATAIERDDLPVVNDKNPADSAPKGRNKIAQGPPWGWDHFSIFCPEGA